MEDERCWKSRNARLFAWCFAEDLQKEVDMLYTLLKDYDGGNESKKNCLGQLARVQVLAGHHAGCGHFVSKNFVDLAPVLHDNAAVLFADSSVGDLKKNLEYRVGSNTMDLFKLIPKAATGSAAKIHELLVDISKEYTRIWNALGLGSNPIPPRFVQLNLC